MNQELLNDCSILGLNIELITTCQIRDVISLYRKKARQCHPDMFSNASEEEKKAKTGEFQELNKLMKEY